MATKGNVWHTIVTMSSSLTEFVSDHMLAWIAFCLLGLRWGLCCAGAGFLLAALAVSAHTVLFVRRAVHATGTVVSNVTVESRSDADGSVRTTFAPQFTFKGADGRSHTVISSISSYPAAFAIGQTVPVLYDPNHPASAKIDTFSQIWGLAVGFFAGGAAASSVGFGWYYRIIRRDREILTIAHSKKSPA
jgi:hypothetical protein